MTVKNNPFTHNLFPATWTTVFQPGKETYSFPAFGGLQFYRSSMLPIYINLGRNHTKGISYTFQPVQSDLGRKVFLVYDVPEYFEQEATEGEGFLKKISIRQYPGYYIELGAFKDLPDYMISSFSKSSRYKLNKYRKRFEQSFNVSYKMYFGEMEKTAYDQVFVQFRHLLEKRFDEKQITNNNLDTKEWKFYESVTYPMILEKQAALFVVYDGDLPIAITLNFLSDSILFDAITVFDIDYGKFHLGSVSIMGLIEWCLVNKMKILDFSKGEFDYKSRWSTRQYNFYYRVYYNPKSLVSVLVAHVVANYFRLKQFLREKKINEKLHQLTYRLRSSSKKAANPPDFVFEELTQEPGADKMVEVDWNTGEFSFLKPAIFSFLYLNGEAKHEFKLFQNIAESNTYLFQGRSKRAEVVCKKPAEGK